MAGLPLAAVDITNARADTGPVYLAEGTTRPGFHEYVALLNTGPAATVTITYLFADGSAPRQHDISLPATSRTTVDVNADVGPWQDVSVGVDPHGNPAISVDRSMYFSTCLRAGLCAQGSDTATAQAPRTSWTFAEGWTGPGFQQFLTIANPGTVPAQVGITYFLASGSPVQKTVVVSPQSRQTVDVNGQLGPYQANSPVIASDQPVVAERVEYFQGCVGDVCGDGGSVSSGSTPAAAFALAEGATWPGFQEYLSLFNPGGTDATARITYLPGAGQGAPVTLTYPVPAHARRTADVNADLGQAEDVSVNLSSDQPLAVERDLYFSFSPTDYHVDGTSTGAGLQAATAWLFAEGFTGPGFAEYVLLANPGSTAANVALTYVFSDGTTQPQSLQVAPGTRRTVNVASVVGAWRQVSVQISSDQPLVAERSLYYGGCAVGLCVDLSRMVLGKVPYFVDTYGLACEIAAMQMGVGSEGIQVSQSTLLADVGVDMQHYWTGDGGGDPYQDFVGSPRGSEIANTGYGAYYTAIARAATDHGARLLAAGEGISPQTVYDAITNGHAVQVWVTYHWQANSRDDYVAYDGRTIPYAGPVDHSVLLAGISPTEVYVDDGDRGQYWVSRSAFETGFAVFDHMAVVYA